ncbi:MAG: M1 family metallopeptidase [Hymenobacteraceae bacterium]|nr:M1 family metallopeptidase [Hymenobacteraceae bacterium]
MLPVRFLTAALLLAASVASAQTAAPTAPLPIPRNHQKAYTAGTRTTTGAPGPNYWQNSAAYTIAVDFDPASRLVKGTVEIDYQNNSTDTLRALVFKLYPNLYQKGAPRTRGIEPADVTDGVKMERLKIGSKNVGVANLRLDGTNLYVPAPTAIAPRSTVRVSLAYSYTLNQGSHQRTGEVAPGAAFVAYFFPRIAVYDDVAGWNRVPYLGDAEFYNDFGTFDVAVTVPRNFVVWATGDLTNADAVLTKKVVKRLREAETKDGYVTVCSAEEARSGDVTAPNPRNTWRFRATDVTDFVFAVADHYSWQATSLVVDPATQRRTRVDAVYDPKHKDYEEVIRFARRTVEAMSYTFPKWPYPYAHETVFDGLDQMEYPMMVNDNPSSNRNDAITLTDHEIFHTMFPFYLGINETKYGWMDEGWASMGEWIISGIIDPKIHDDYGMPAYNALAGTESDPPIMTLTTSLTDRAVLLNSYAKPAMGYYYVRDLLGEEGFTKALHYYIRTWHGKHPLPLDFFHAMNAGAGQDLTWFWRRWFYEGGVPDLAIAGVEQTVAVAGTATVQIEAKGTKPVPIDLTITFADGTTQIIHRTIAVWADPATTRVAVPVTGTQAIKSIKLGSLYVADVNPADNVWPVAK